MNLLTFLAVPTPSNTVTDLDLDAESQRQTGDNGNFSIYGVGVRPLISVHIHGTRLAAAIQTSLAVLLAFLVAPFQHVHQHHPGDPHAGEMHAHFFVAHTHERHLPSDRIGIDDDDDDDHAHVRSVDTYTPVLPGAPLVVLPRLGTVISAPQVLATAPVRNVETRNNGPPAARPSSPRAPPL